MAKSVTYTCDRCKKTAVDDESFLKRVSLQMEHNYKPGTVKGWVPLEADWCKQCQERFRLIDPNRWVQDPAAIEAAAHPPTLEEAIRAIVNEEIDAR